MRRYLDYLWVNRPTLILAALSLLAAGWLSLAALPRSVFPQVDFPRVTVLVSDANLPVKFMLLQVTEPLEEVAKGVSGVRLVRSQSGVGLSKIHVYFDSRTNPRIAYLMLEARLAQVPLPPGARMTVLLMTPHIKPFAEYALVSDRIGSADMRPFFAFTVRPALLSVRGVYQVSAIGRGWPQVEVDLSRQRLAEHHLSADSVITALRQSQGPFYGGLIRAFHQQFIVINQPRPVDPTALGQLTLPLGPRGPDGNREGISLSSLAAVHIGPPPLIIGAAVSGYRHALLVDVSAQAGANVVTVARQVQSRIQGLRARLPAHVHLVRIYDFSHLVRHSLDDVWTALLLGTAAAWLAVLLFLRRLDSALATLLVVPLALAGTFVFLHMLGFGINIMTLGGITAAMGALVDHAIVVMERGLRRLPPDAPSASRRHMALAACAEILPLMTFATLTSTVVFVPLVFLSGTLGLLFRHMALAIVIALLVSQLVALSLTPVLAAWLAQRPQRTERQWRWARRLHLRYSRLLRIGLRRPWLAVPTVALLSIGGLIAGWGLPTAFLPQWDEGAVAVPFRTPVGTSSAETLSVGRRLAAVAAHNPSVARVSVMVGRSFANSRSTSNKGDLAVILKPYRRRTTTAVMQALRSSFRAADPSLIELKLHQIMSNRLENLSGSLSPLSVMLFGKNPVLLHHYGHLLQERVRASGHFENTVFKSPSAGPELVLTPRARGRLLGLDPAQVAGQVRDGYWGQRAGFLLRGEQILPIRVTVGANRSVAPQTLANYPVRLPDGGWVPLRKVARVAMEGAVPYVTHDNLVPYAYLWMAPKPGEGLAAAAARVRALIAAVHLPVGITAEISGYYRQQSRGFQQMGVILGGALLVLLILLGFQFGGQRPALAALIGIAVASPGAFFALRITGTPLDSTAFLGVLLVFSIAVNNVILIFSLARRNPTRAVGVAAVARSAHARVRPIMMTMLADVLGFLPIAIGVGRGTDLLRPLAIAVMGGLTLALFSSLWLAPVLYAGLLRLFPSVKD